MPNQFTFSPVNLVATLKSDDGFHIKVRFWEKSPDNWAGYVMPFGYYPEGLTKDDFFRAVKTMFPRMRDMLLATENRTGVILVKGKGFSFSLGVEYFAKFDDVRFCYIVHEDPFNVESPVKIGGSYEHVPPSLLDDLSPDCLEAFKDQHQAILKQQSAWWTMFHR